MWTGSTEYVSLTGRLYKDPGLWGFLFCQLAHHVARAYELNGHESAAGVLNAIRKRFDEEWKLPDETSGELFEDEDKS